MCSIVNDNWIYIYYKMMQNGDVVVGKWIRLWYEIVMQGLLDRTWFFDQKRAAEVINFIERYCHHHEGPLAPGLLKLEPWQKAEDSVIYGIVDSSGHRQFREIVEIMGRKQGKTAHIAARGCYHLFKNGGYGARVMIGAPKLDQARLCYEGIYQTIRKEPMMERLTKRRRTDIYIESTNSSAQPIAFSAKKSDGLNISMGILDEIGAFPGLAGLRMAEVFKSSQGARIDPQMFYTSTANFVDEGLYDEILKRSTAVLQGTSKEKRLAPFLYMIDDVEKWNDMTELHKSMPNLGVSVSEDYIQEEIAVAEGSLSKRSEFITKYCNIKQNSSLAWLKTSDIQKVFGNNYRLEDFRNCYCLGGIDLSQTTDLTACCILIQRDDVIWIFCQFFLPRDKIADATARDGVPYDIMIQRGLLTVSGDAVVDYHDCFNWFKRLVQEYKIFPLMIGYDRYTAAYLVQEMEEFNFHMESVFQGYNLTGIENDFEGMVQSGKLRCADDNDLLKLHFIDAAQQIESGTSAHARKKLVKISKNAHVDGVAAILDALCMRANHWQELGQRLENKRR